MDTSGYYKLDADQILAAPNSVDGPGYSLTRDNHADNTYPVDGWYWCDSYAAALALLASSGSPRHITKLAFLSRFTDAEAIQIDLASIGATVPAASMRRYLNKVNVATFIDLDNAETRAGVEALESSGLIAAGRATEILDAPVAVSERA